MGKFLGTNISQTTKLIFFTFGMSSHVYGGDKSINLVQIGPGVIEIQEVENGKLIAFVNNTLKCSTFFLATDIRLCLDIVS